LSSEFIGFIALIHRVGIILAVIPSMVIIILPNLFPETDDLEFARKAYLFLSKLSKFGLIILVLSGVIRLVGGFPAFLLVKLIFVAITVFLYFNRNIDYGSQEYTKEAIYRFVLLGLTAITGILI
jgi:hypothetical protein